MFLGKDVLKIYSKFTRKHPRQGVISKKLFCSFIEITLLDGVLLQICFTFSGHFFLGTPLRGKEFKQRLFQQSCNTVAQKQYWI